MAEPLEKRIRALVRNTWASKLNRSKDELVVYKEKLGFIKIEMAGTESIDIHKSQFEKYFAALDNSNKQVSESCLNDIQKALKGLIPG